MNAMNGKCNSSVFEAADFEIKPTLGIALIFCAGCITGCPYAVVLIGVLLNSIKIA